MCLRSPPHSALLFGCGDSRGSVRGCEDAPRTDQHGTDTGNNHPFIQRHFSHFVCGRFHYPRASLARAQYTTTKTMPRRNHMDFHQASMRYVPLPSMGSTNCASMTCPHPPNIDQRGTNIPGPGARRRSQGVGSYCKDRLGFVPCSVADASYILELIATGPPA